MKKSGFAVLNERKIYVNGVRLYYAYFEKIPSITEINFVSKKSAIKWIEEKLSEHIIQKHFRQTCDTEYKAKGFYTNEIIYVLKNEILIKVNVWGVLFFYFDEMPESVSEWVKEIKKMKAKFNAKLSLLIENNGLQLVDIKNTKPKLSMQSNYNDDLNVLHTNIINELKKKDNAGLFLFYGAPGTGKSTYIRHLTYIFRKHTIFIPPRVAGNLDSPGFTNILINNRNSVIIIEDAEELLVSREKGKTSCISMLLNMTDGMLGESLGIQFICTFNSSVIDIDKALLRKGRLKALYEFKPLSIMKSIGLLEKMNITDYTVKEPMTLADIYNVREKHFEFKNTHRKPIGFVANGNGIKS